MRRRLNAGSALIATVVVLVVAVALIEPLTTQSSRAQGSGGVPHVTSSAGAANVAVAATDPRGGEWVVTSNGQVSTLGSASPFGSIGVALNQPIVGISTTIGGGGYWLVASDGGIFSFGDAQFYGSTGSLQLNRPIVGMAATPDGLGYWLVASDGGIFSFGDAQFYGSTGSLQLNRPIVGMAVTPDGGGYWLVASDGGIFSFGDAQFFGSTGSIQLNQPIVGMAATSDGGGYWMVASDGGIFSFGDAQFLGSASGQTSSPAIGLIVSDSGQGYDVVNQGGSDYSFGDDLGFGGSLTSKASPAKSKFVSRTGAALSLNGQSYRYSGINVYMAASGGTTSSCGGGLYPNVSVPLSQIPSGSVIRFWAFQNFFVSKGKFNWANLDQVLAIAAAHNDKVIPVLANEHSYCDAMVKTLGWFKTGYSSAIDTGDLVPYRQYVADIVSRYSSNPTIAMWQLVNEGQAVNPDGSCNESAALGALTGFSKDVGGLVHSLDPNHLVSLGVLAGYSGSGAQWCGAAFGDYQTLMASPGTDVCDFHDYGHPTSPMGNPVAPNLTTAIQMCHADNKPIMVGESGILADNPAALAPRAAEFDAKLAAQFQAGVSGDLMWGWSVKALYAIPDTDADYGIFPGDPSLAVLSHYPG